MLIKRTIQTEKNSSKKQTKNLPTLLFHLCCISTVTGATGINADPDTVLSSSLGPDVTHIALKGSSGHSDWDNLCGGITFRHQHDFMCVVVQTQASSLPVTLTGAVDININ